MSLSVIVLAAGMGTRMRSRLPKVLHDLAGRPLLGHVLDTAASLQPQSVQVVYGHGGELVREHVSGENINWVEQAEQLGTGHAVMQALPGMADEELALVLYGDVPMIQVDTLARLAEAASSGLALLTADFDDPSGYGRIVRDDANAISAIVEEKDASAEIKQIREINTGFLAAPVSSLKRWLGQCSNDNAQGEYYLTDIVAMAVAGGVTVSTVKTSDCWEVAGVNDRLQLAGIEREFQRRQADELMRRGLALRDPARFDLRGKLEIGQDVMIDVNAVIEGRVNLGDGVRIGPNCYLRDADIGADTVIESHSIIDGAKVGEACQIGPFARLRPAAQLAARAKVGNFVEIKKSTIGEGSKVNHLSYIGDAELGKGVNVGAGTITCNYDGANKFQTIIGDGAFIGSNTELVAPVRVGAGATVGAGTTLSRDVDDGALAVTRAPQKSLANWPRPQKKPNK
jgi:bifunctional UDP-N-acetylglucosamine pyrophosphorylase/glucosamine-1-phosphate N-acetyltransferase